MYNLQQVKMINKSNVAIYLGMHFKCSAQVGRVLLNESSDRFASSKVFAIYYNSYPPITCMGLEVIEAMTNAKLQKLC